MKYLLQILAFVSAMVCSYEFKHVQAQAQSVNPLQVEDATMLQTMGATAGFIDTRRVWGADQQGRYYWKAGVPTGERTAEYINKHYIVMCLPLNAGKGYYTAIRYLLPIDNIIGADSAIHAWGYPKYADIPAQVNADWNSVSGSSAILNKPALLKGDTGANGQAGLTGQQGIQGVKGDTGDQGLIGAAGPQGLQGIQGVAGTSATPNTASTPLSITGNNVSIQIASESQSGALSAADWTTFNRKLSSFTETDPTVSSTVKSITSGNIALWNDKSYASLTGKPILFDGQYSSLTGRPILFDGNYNSLSNLPTLFTVNQANSLYRPITYSPSASDITTGLGYTPYNGATNPNGYVGSSALSTYQPLITAGTTAQYYRGDKTFQTLNTLAVPELTNLYYTDVRARTAIGALPNGGITYNAATGEVSQTTPTYNNAPARALNTSYKPSTVRPTRVSYTVSVASVVSVGQAIAYLEISVDGTNWTIVNSAGETSVGLLNTKYYNLQAEVPANYFFRIRSAVTLGGQVTFMSGQEVLY